MDEPRLQELLDKAPFAFVQAAVNGGRRDPTVTGQIDLRLEWPGCRDTGNIRAYLTNGEQLSLKTLLDLLPLVDDEFAKNPAFPEVFIHSQYAKFDWLMAVAKEQKHQPAINWLRKAGVH